MEGVGGWESEPEESTTTETSGNVTTQSHLLQIHHEPVWIYDVACFNNNQTEIELITLAEWVKTAANQESVYLRLPSGQVIFV